MSKLERQPLVGKYKPYPEYKDSGVEWLGKIPSHWAIKKIAWYFKAQKGRNAQMLTKEFCGENPGDFPVYSGQTENDGVMGSINSYEFDSAQDGCLFATTVGAKAMTLSFLKGKFSLSQNCMVITPTSDVIDTRFYFYHCQPLFSYERGLIPEHMQASFRMEDLYQYQIAMPNLQEQQTIAAFLDYETARIDWLIAQQQRLIELLKEKRQAVISHAVTKGLNPDAPMKDSGIEWLGQIPDHWLSNRVGWCCQVGNGCTPSRDNMDYWSEGTYPWLNSGKVNDGYIISAEQFVTVTALKECSLPKVPAGSIVMAITGEGKTRGSIAITGIDTTLSQHLAFITVTSKKLSPMYLRIWLESQYQRIRFESEGWGSTKAAITCSDIKSYPLPEPPLNEQLKIVEYVGERSKTFDLLIQKSESMISVLQERRTALISAAVTGKIDLRGWTPPAEEAAS